MSILTNVRDFFRANPADRENLKTEISGGLRMVNAQYYPDVEKTFDFLKNCGTPYDILKGEAQARLSEMMYEIFPFAKRAVNDMAGMVGNACFESIKTGDVSEDVLDELYELSQTLPILSEHDPLEAHQHGLDNLIYRVAKGILIHGQFMTEDRYSEDLDYQGSLLFYPPNFRYQYWEGRNRLYYRSLQEVKPGPFFSVSGYDWRESGPWAFPLMSGGRFFSRLLLSVFVAIQNISLRKGAPVQAMLIGVDNDEVFKNPDTASAYTNFISKFKDRTEDAVEAQYRGVSSPIVGGSPANIKLLSQTFGAEMVQEIDYRILDRIMVQVLNLLDVPPEQAGIVLGSAGFSPERFKIQFKIWSGKIDNIRNEIKPVIWKRTLNHFRAEGVDPVLLERVCLDFENVPIADDRENAEIAERQAAANEKHGKVMDQLNMLIGPDAAIEYGIRHGLIETEE